MIIEASAWNAGLSDAVRFRTDKGEIFFYARKIEAVLVPPILFVREYKQQPQHITKTIKRFVGDRAARVVHSDGKELHDMAVNVLASSVATAFDERIG